MLPIASVTCRIALECKALRPNLRLEDRKEEGMVRSTIRIVIPPKKQNEALEILGSMTEQIQFEPGCISCRLYKGVDSEGVIMFEELWMSEEDVQRHLRSDKYRKILLVVEMAAEPPEIRFDAIAQSSGVETIAKARSQTEPADRIR